LENRLKSNALESANPFIHAIQQLSQGVAITRRDSSFDPHGSKLKSVRRKEIIKCLINLINSSKNISQ